MTPDRLLGIYRLAYKEAGAADRLPPIKPLAPGLRTAGRLPIDYYPSLVTNSSEPTPADRRRPVTSPFTYQNNPISSAGRANYVRPDGTAGYAHMRSDAKGNLVPYAWSRPLSGNPTEFTTTMRRGDIRPMLYGASAKERERQETADAYAARWSRLMALAPDQKARADLEARRRMGQIPPIIMRGAFNNGRDGAVLEDSWFGDPNEPIQATVVPGGGRSEAYPQTRNLFIGGYGLDALRHWREEWAHQASFTPKRKRTSVVDGILGGDDYTAAKNKGLKPIGSYELNPVELTRMVLLQKAAAARLGYDRFRTVDEWKKFTGAPVYKPAEGVAMPAEGAMDNPFAPGGNGQFDISTDGRQVLNILNRLEKGKESAPDEQSKAWYTERYNQLHDALQDAIDMAKYGQQDENRMNA